MQVRDSSRGHQRKNPTLKKIKTFTLLINLGKAVSMAYWYQVDVLVCAVRHARCTRIIPVNLRTVSRAKDYDRALIT